MERSGSLSDSRRDRTCEVARELLLTCGYKRTTVEEIARRAGIGKGTVYLFWNSKDDLIRFLLLQDIAAVLGEIADAVRADLHAALLHRVVHKLFTASADFPLFRAWYARDTEVVGNIVRGLPGGGRRYHLTSLEPFGRYLQALADNHLLRTGPDVELAFQSLDAMIAGFFVIEESWFAWKSDLILPRARLLATMVHHSIESPGLPTHDTIAQVAVELIAAFDGFALATR